MWGKLGKGFVLTRLGGINMLITISANVRNESEQNHLPEIYKHLEKNMASHPEENIPQVTEDEM